LEHSLTVLLPVRNAQSSLAASVQEVLEVVSELSRQFELVIIDDGSTDATSEVAHELSRCYPQVRTVSHAKPLGQEAAVRAGLRRSKGRIIMLRDGAGGLRIVDRGSLERGHPGSRPSRPNYLARLKSLALGE
jgi:glycosyltransferase involved in cell wall biosynthesis